jgi:hypothetical protein
MLLLLAAWGVMTAVGIQGVQKGNISVLRRGSVITCAHHDPSGLPTVLTVFRPVQPRSRPARPRGTRTLPPHECGVSIDLSSENEASVNYVGRYDWNGNICTHKSGKPYFYPVNVRTMGVCLEACPTTTDFSTLHCIGGVAPTTLTAPGLVQNGYCLYQLETEQVHILALPSDMKQRTNAVRYSLSTAAPAMSNM